MYRHKSIWYDLLGGLGAITILFTGRSFDYHSGHRISKSLLNDGFFEYLICITMLILIICRTAKFRHAVSSTMLRVILICALPGFAFYEITLPNPFLQGFSDRLRATVNPADLQTWAIGVIPENMPHRGGTFLLPNGESITSQPGNDGDIVGNDIIYLSPDHLPPALKKLGHQPHIFVHYDPTPDHRYVELIYGDRWGLYVGSAAFLKPPDYNILEWIPGAYFVNGMPK